MIEILESRVLFATDFNGETLRVSGTAANDVITFTRDGDQLIVDVNGEQSQFKLRSIRFLDVYGGAGDDLIVLGSMTLRTRVDGAEGNDTLSGGRGGDLLIGGEGSDAIYGLDGDDWIDPGHIYDGESSFITDGAADTVSGGAGKDTVLSPHVADDASAFEATDLQTDSNPVFMSFGAPRVSFVTRDDGNTYARIIQTFSDTGAGMTVMDVRRDGLGLVVVLEARHTRHGAGQAITDEKVEANLGQLAPGAYTVRVVDRWGGTVKTARFEAPVAPVQIISADGINLRTHVNQGLWSVLVDLQLPDSGYGARVGKVQQRGNKFFLEVVGFDPPQAPFGTGGPTGHHIALGELPPGTYTFNVTSEGRFVETLKFTVP